MSKESDYLMLMLGQITPNHAFIEYALRNCILILVGSDPRIADAILGNQTFESLLVRLDEVSKLKLGEGTPEYDRFRGLLVRVRKANKDRNDAVHAITEEVEGRLVRRGLRRGVEPRRLRSEDMAGLSSEVLQVATDVAGFMQEVTNRFLDPKDLERFWTALAGQTAAQETDRAARETT